MKATVRPNKSTVIEVEGETQKELFKEMASAHEVFGEKQCGLCQCEEIVPAYRTVTQGKKTYEYPEYHCTNPKCRARLSLGSMMEGGGLFPIRKLIEDGPEKGKPDREKGVYGPHNGWSRYKGTKNEGA